MNFYMCIKFGQKMKIAQILRRGNIVVHIDAHMEEVFDSAGIFFFHAFLDPAYQYTVGKTGKVNDQILFLVIGDLVYAGYLLDKAADGFVAGMPQDLVVQK